MSHINQQSREKGWKMYQVRSVPGRGTYNRPTVSSKGAGVEIMTKEDWPITNTKTYRILEAVDRLSKGTTTGRTPVAEIYLDIGGGKETVRSLLSQLRKEGLVETPMRGIYRVTEKGQKVLKEVA